MNKESIKIGNLIIADTNILNDFNFNRSVILLTEHSTTGSLGFILNKKLKIRIKDIIPNSDCNFNIYYGGPVEPENLYFIHNVPHLVSNSIEIADGIFWGGDFNKILEFINNDLLKKSNIRFFLGYTGWDFKQLDQEIENKSWLIKSNIYKSEILKKVPTNLWKELMKTFGNKQMIWSNAPEDPVLN